MNSESDDLQRQAMALVREYWWALAPAKGFFRKLAKHLNWTDLEKIL
jgi:hypothetical protein